jgi:hypothetical protein
LTRYAYPGVLYEADLGTDEVEHPAPHHLTLGQMEFINDHIDVVEVDAHV